MDTHRLPPACVVLEGPAPGLWHTLTRARMGSPWQHAWMLLDAWAGIESTWAGVRTFDPLERFAQLEQGRAFVILDPYWLTDDERRAVADSARSFVGRGYDFGQWLWWALTRSFWDDGTGRMICSRLLTAAFEAALDTHPFDHDAGRSMGAAHRRRGWVTPNDWRYCPYLRCIVAVQSSVPSLHAQDLPTTIWPSPWGDRHAVGSPRPPKEV